MEPQRYPHHRAYVGGPQRFDVLGARHFMLLFMLGLREGDRLLDFGCGSLRSGRLLIPYLLPGRYFGIDPNRWLIDAGIRSELGEGILAVKSPRFDHNADFDLSVFDEEFQFIHAHSVFTHAPAGAIETFFRHAHDVLSDCGLVLGSFAAGATDYTGSEWAYPQVIRYTPGTFAGMVTKHGLEFRPIRWPHHAQTYFLAARDPGRIDKALTAAHSEYGIDLGVSSTTDPFGD